MMMKRLLRLGIEVMTKMLALVGVWIASSIALLEALERNFVTGWAGTLLAFLSYLALVYWLMLAIANAPVLPERESRPGGHNRRNHVREES